VRCIVPPSANPALQFIHLGPQLLDFMLEGVKIAHLVSPPPEERNAPQASRYEPHHQSDASQADEHYPADDDERDQNPSTQNTSLLSPARSSGAGAGGLPPMEQ